MMAREEGVKKKSEYFLHTPGTQAQKTFFYPLVVGHSFYEKDYFLHRETFDSFLIMHICRGSCMVSPGDGIFRAQAGQTVLLDCYRSHAYYSDGREWEALWVHFDGPMSRGYYEHITEKGDIVLSHRNPAEFVSELYRLYEQFRNGERIKEGAMAARITNLLTALSLSGESASERESYSGMVEASVAYIREHLCEEGLSLETLSRQANLSLYYYTRLFKRETGFTPHEYILRSRVNMAKYLLKSTRLSAKEICFRCGFRSESAFCHTFRKWEQVTPGQFRRTGDPADRREGGR